MKLVLGWLPKIGKGKKSKTKCQQKRKNRFNDNPRYELTALKGYTVRQVSKYKFIVTYSTGAELYDMKRKTVETIVANYKSKIGRRFAK